jgi:predicted nucleic acid-binding protein
VNKTGALFDTSVAIDIAAVPANDLPEEASISAVTLAELTVGPHTAQDARERGKRQRQLEYLETAFQPLPFDASAAREYGVICAVALAAGCHQRRRPFDYMIAATARANGLPLYTRNPQDFEGLEELVEIVTFA